MPIKRHLVTAVLMTSVMTALLGMVYPIAITMLAQLLFTDNARGQLIVQNGRLVGSRIIGQRFSSPGYFRSRPSAAGRGYDASDSGGSNLGPTNRKLLEAINSAAEAVRRENRDQPVPVDLVTSSASGLDPDLSPAAALFQAPRVARERGVHEDEVRRLVQAHQRGRQLGIFGEPSVNVLELNLALDARWPLTR